MRRNVLQGALAKSLSLADEVVVAAVFKSEAIPESERMDLAVVAKQIEKNGRRARVINDVDSIEQLTAHEMRPGDVVAILSNGGFGGIYEKLPQRLSGQGASGPRNGATDSSKSSVKASS